ncbi:MAG: sodium:solute symporter family protein [Clostridiales bacterium]|jgi:SSS family solute:Na+ symporter|nr:sodium:solute symporter family protein [Clostridiales bacterium]
MTTYTIIGIVVTIVVFIGLSVFAGTRVKSVSDFISGSGKSSSFIVAGTIMGTLVGGASTVGTAQLAYTNGLSAWWFTLGGGIAALILAICFIKPLRNAGSPTLVGIVCGEFGQNIGLLASILSSVGIFINILSQLLSAVAVIIVIAPTVGTVPALIIAAILMVAYVTLGGIKGAGMVGMLKLILLYFTVVFCAAAVLVLTKGLNAFLMSVSNLGGSFGLFSRGFGLDSGACVSLIFGVLTTQTYGQAVMSGKTDRASRAGALISTVMIPPVGIGGILVGLYMRTVNNPTVAGNTSLALTEFILHYVPPFLGGIMLATLLFAVVGTGAGLALGISTIINNDIVGKLLRNRLSSKTELLLSRMWIIIILAIGVVMAAVLGKTAIQSFSYMSMGLRGAVMFMPLMLALFAQNRVRKGFVLVSVIGGPVIVLIFGIWKVFSFDPLFIGLAFCLTVCLIGFFAGKKDGGVSNRLIS